MASHDRSLIAGMISSILAWAHSASVYLGTAVNDIAYRVADLIMLPFRLFAPDPRLPLTHALHPTHADDVRRASPFKAFMARARERWTFVGDHFLAPMVSPGA